MAQSKIAERGILEKLWARRKKRRLRKIAIENEFTL